MRTKNVPFVIGVLFSISGITALNAFSSVTAKTQMDIPKDNPLSIGKIELGKKLFFDPRLSRNGAISCNSCHNVMLGGEDNRKNSIGVGDQRGGRSAPTVWNAAFMSVQFWDGRAPSLEEQAKGPLTNPIEMAMASHGLVVERIQKIPGYVEEFKRVFPNDKKDLNLITIDRVAQAIASYERTLVTSNSHYDRFMRGEKNAISLSAMRGKKEVESIGCLSCHSGSNFSGPKLPMGQGFFMKFPVVAGSEYEKKYDLTSDLGRFTVTQNESDKNVWRVPTWKNIAITAPYFHNGAVKTLPEAVRVMAKTQLGRDLSVNQTNDIVAFLETLTGEFPEQKLPHLPVVLGESLNED